ncbi:MAG: dihydrofolate reductase [Rhodospirillales bacterium]
MRISLIVARAENGVIGRDGGLPWRLSADLKYFKAQTMGKPMIMGRKTFDSIGKALPGRTSIVITRDRNYRADGIVVAHDWDGALAAARAALARTGGDEAMVIGGAQVYAMALPFADRLYVTEIHRAVDGDTVFPAIDPAHWREVSREDFEPETGDGPAFSFVVFEKAA